MDRKPYENREGGDVIRPAKENAAELTVEELEAVAGGLRQIIRPEKKSGNGN